MMEGSNVECMLFGNHQLLLSYTQASLCPIPPSLPVMTAVQTPQAKQCPIPASNDGCVGIPGQAVPHPCQQDCIGVSFEAAQHCLLSLPCCVRPSRHPPIPCPVVLLIAGTCHRMAFALAFLLLWLEFVSKMAMQ